MPTIHQTTFPPGLHRAQKKVLAGAFMQKVLQSELNVSHPLKIERTAQGKPYLLDYTDLAFNYSDSGDMAVLATDRHPIGVDMELIRPRSFQGILDRFFLPEEREPVLAAGTDKDRLACFFRLWTAKESLLKYVGCGLGGEMRRYTVCGGYAVCEGRMLLLQTYVVKKDGGIMVYQEGIADVGDTLLTICTESPEEARFIFYPE